MLELITLYQLHFYGTKWQMRNRSGFRWVTLPGISFINIRCQLRLEGNNNPYLLFPSRTERPLPS